MKNQLRVPDFSESTSAAVMNLVCLLEEHIDKDKLIGIYTLDLSTFTINFVFAAGGYLVDFPTEVPENGGILKEIAKEAARIYHTGGYNGSI